METTKTDSFTITLGFEDVSWQFNVRKHPSADARFHVAIINTDGEPVEFVLIQSSIGKWIPSGEAIPEKLQQYAQDIGKAFEANIPCNSH